MCVEMRANYVKLKITLVFAAAFSLVTTADGSQRHDGFNIVNGDKWTGARGF